MSMFRRAWLALVVAAGVLAVPNTSASAAGTTNGPLLYDYYLLNLGTGAKTMLPSGLGLPTQFSPDGSKVGSLFSGCTGQGCTPIAQLETTTHDGVRDTVTTFGPTSAWSLSWSPDGSKIAVLVQNANDPSKGSIVVVDAVTGAKTTVQASSSTFIVNGTSQISWNPTNDKIAFVGTELKNGLAHYVDTDQIYTVNAGTLQRARYNTHGAASCAAPSPCPGATFSDVDWAPDGSKIVGVTEYDPNTTDDTISSTAGVATIGEGESTPHFVFHYEDDFYSVYSGPFFSPDGTKILFTHNVNSDAVGGIIPADGGTVRDLDSPYFLDWQPCPNGVCVKWGQTATKVASTITLNYTVSSSVRVNGQVTPKRAGESVVVKLQKSVRGNWVTMASKSQLLSANSRYVITLPLQGVFTCRAVARYPGDARTKPSTATKFFSC
jgi:Tol biopolymer transport system component